MILSVCCKSLLALEKVVDSSSKVVLHAYVLLQSFKLKTQDAASLND
jgi:hypothetical protein